MAGGVQFVIYKNKDGGVDHIERDFTGYKGKSCMLTDEKLVMALRARGINVEDKNVEFKPEYYLDTEETMDDELSL